MHYDWKIECLEVENVYKPTWMACLWFDNFRFHLCHLMVLGAFRAEVGLQAELPSVLVEVRRFLCSSSVSAHSLLYHFSMEGSRLYNFYKPLPGVFLSQPSTFYAQQTQLLAFSLLGLRCEVSWLVVALPLLRHAKALLWPYSPYLWEGACRTIPAAPDLLHSPW